MKYRVTRFNSLEVCLKELEPFIRNGEHLQTGKPFKRFDGLRSREILANWLLCVVLNFECGAARFTFISDPRGGDGIICDSLTDQKWPTEHVLVPTEGASEARDVEILILQSVLMKQNKGGAAYASGKILIVLLNVGGERWFPNKVAKHLPETLDFNEVWVAGLQVVDAGKYVYGVTRLDVSKGDAPTWIVRIGENFDVWEVKRIQ